MCVYDVQHEMTEESVVVLIGKDTVISPLNDIQESDQKEKRNFTSSALSL